MNNPKIVVFGAGAVGAYFGAMLAQSGLDVVLVGRGATVQRVEHRGLEIRRSSGVELAPVRMIDSGDARALRDAVSDSDWVFVAVKSPDSENAAIALKAAGLDSRRSAVFSLQNGVDNAERLGATLGQCVYPVVVYVAVETLEPGVLRHHGRGELVFGVPDREALLRQALLHVLPKAGIPLQIENDVSGALWAKLLINCAYNGWSAISGLPYGELMQEPGGADSVRDLAFEVASLAQARGVTLPVDPWAACLGIAQTMATQRSSTWQDLSRGRRTEIDHLNGFVVREAEKLGVPVPANRAVWLAVRFLERQRAVK